MLLILNILLSPRPLRYSLLLLLARITYYSLVNFGFCEPPTSVAVPFLRILVLLFSGYFTMSLAKGWDTFHLRFYRAWPSLATLLLKWQGHIFSMFLPLLLPEPLLLRSCVMPSPPLLPLPSESGYCHFRVRCSSSYLRGSNSSIASVFCLLPISLSRQGKVLSLLITNL